MCIVLKLECSTADCKSPEIHGGEECHFRDGIPSMPGSSLLPYGETLIDDLYTKARAAGWHCDGTRWFCVDCVKRDYLAYMQPFIAEAVAHASNV